MKITFDDNMRNWQLENVEQAIPKFIQTDDSVVIVERGWYGLDYKMSPLPVEKIEVVGDLTQGRVYLNLISSTFPHFWGIWLCLTEGEFPGHIQISKNEWLFRLESGQKIVGLDIQSAMERILGEAAECSLVGVRLRGTLTLSEIRCE